MDLDFITKTITEDLSIPEIRVRNTISLLNDAATIHFIARYRKEKTQNLDETQIRNIADKLGYYSELEKRKETILKTIQQQDKLTPQLEQEIKQCRQKQKLEDLYLPYKPKKRTKATIAKEKGLEPLADIILLQWTKQGQKEKIVDEYINPQKKVTCFEDAIAGAIDIVAEKICENALIREYLRGLALSEGKLTSKAQKKWAEVKSKYHTYYKFSEPIKEIPSHRILAVRRGTKEKILSWKIELDEDRAINLMETKLIKNKTALFFQELQLAIRQSYKNLLSSSIETEIFLLKIADAEKEAINVFSKNLRNLLLSAPAGHKIIMGLDPGFRTGCKLAIINTNGDFKEHNTIFPHPPNDKKEKAENLLTKSINKYSIELIAIGNGTASKETKLFVNEVIKNHNLSCRSIIVSEAGASVYSASDTAKAEFPKLDVTVRGAISIARRLQDPLSELVKIDPKSIGVGQYQHDVNQTELKESLDFIVSSCVNLVGVDLNTASGQLLSYVSGIGKSIAASIIKHRSQHGSFSNKTELLRVTKLADKVFEQCAGFLRIPDAENPLDNSAIHPESYPIVEKMAQDFNLKVSQLIGKEEIISRIDASLYITKDRGLPTLNDILKELKKPGLDPREDFSSIEHSCEINQIQDLNTEMILEGAVTNVTNFGAFVDIGVHRDGLIHISRLSENFVKNPHDIISVGQRVKVKIISVDKELERINLELLN